MTDTNTPDYKTLEDAKKPEKHGFSKTLIGILALLIGVFAGAGGFYLLGTTPRLNLEEELELKSRQVDSLQVQLDSLRSQLMNAKDISPVYAATLKRILDPDTLNEVMSLGTAVGGKWSVRSAEDVTFLGSDLVFIRMDDGHLVGMALLRVPDTADLKSWRTLWGEYE